MCTQKGVQGQRSLINGMLLPDFTKRIKTHSHQIKCGKSPAEWLKKHNNLPVTDSCQSSFQHANNKKSEASCADPTANPAHRIQLTGVDDLSLVIQPDSCSG